jgi:hypothetical protein
MGVILELTSTNHQIARCALDNNTWRSGVDLLVTFGHEEQMYNTEIPGNFISISFFISSSSSPSTAGQVHISIILMAEDGGGRIRERVDV